jgi:hypothetical protein
MPPQAVANDAISNLPRNKGGNEGAVPLTHLGYPLIIF